VSVEARARDGRPETLNVFTVVRLRTILETIGTNMILEWRPRLV